MQIRGHTFCYLGGNSNVYQGVRLSGVLILRFSFQGVSFQGSYFGGS